MDNESNGNGADPVAASRRVDASEAGENAVAAELDSALFDMRLAAVLNVMSMAMEHGERRDWTNEDARQIRNMLTIVNATVAANPNAVVPSGFGPVVRTHQAALIVKAQAKAQKANAVGADISGRAI